VNRTDTARVEAFSDGVFAIAITLLILEIKVPHLPEGAGSADVFRALCGLWPSYLSFIASFAVILIMWVNHHGLFKMVRHADSRFMFANGLLLMLVTFVPFPTALMAEYLDRAGANAAVAFYNGTFILISTAYCLLWISASHKRRLLHDHVTDDQIARVSRAYYMAFPIYVTATLVALWNPYIGFGINASLWILWIALQYGDTENGITE
jgi:uncharacterized membrane protein